MLKLRVRVFARADRERMFDTGFFTIVRWKGTPIRLHWSIALGALLFSGFRFAPVFWASFFGLVLIHEIGHALIVRRYGHHVHAIDVTGFGGLCRWSGHASPFERAAIAWGGVLAQAVVLVATVAVVLVLGRPTTAAGAEVVSVFTRTNVILIALNLLPLPPLDGAEAWPIFRHLKGRFRSVGSTRPRRRAPRPPRTASPRPRVTRKERRAGNGAHQGSGNAKTDEALAEMFEKISEEARRARRRD